MLVLIGNGHGDETQRSGANHGQNVYVLDLLRWRHHPVVPKKLDALQMHADVKWTDVQRWRRSNVKRWEIKADVDVFEAELLAKTQIPIAEELVPINDDTDNFVSSVSGHAAEPSTRSKMPSTEKELNEMLQAICAEKMATKQRDQEQRAMEQKRTKEQTNQKERDDQQQSRE